MQIRTEEPIKLKIALAVLSELTSKETMSASEVRKIALISEATANQRDQTLEALRTLEMITPFGGSGRGRVYKITTYGSEYLKLLIK